MRHILKSGMMALMALTASTIFAQQTGYAGANPAQRAANCTFFTLTPNATSPTCNGANNGIASVAISGGVGPFTFIWVGGPTTQSWPNVGAGTYTVIVFDQGQGGAACNIDVFINEPGALTVFGMNAIAPTCFGACNGSAFPIVIGGAGGYTLTWPDGATGISNSNLCNPFTLIITDASGCSVDTTYTFENEPQEIIADADITQISCNGQNNGTIDLTISGGSPDYIIGWTGPNGFNSSLEDISNLSAGTYTVEITDANNCIAQESFIISEPDEIEVTADITNNECATDSIAAITINISGGTSPFAVVWSGPNSFSSNNQNINNLLTGSYNLQLTDSNNCVFEAVYEITAAPPIDITLNVSEISCSGADDGSIETTISGGSGNYTLVWTGPDGFSSPNQNIANLAAGTYTVEVTDDEGCSNTGSAEITESAILTINTVFTNVSCAGANDGEITLTISGGTPDYTISWTGPNNFSSSSQNLTSLLEGTYNVEVTDSNNCSESAEVNISAPSEITLNVATEDVVCAGQNNGFANLTISGGQPDYNIIWSGPNGFTSNSENIANLEAGIYAVIVTDAANCVESTQITIAESDSIVVNANITQPECADSENGEITLSITGGNPTLDGDGNPIYNVSWTGPSGFTSNSIAISNLIEGTYEVTVQDDSGCETSATYQITAPNELEIIADATGVSCALNDGSVSISVNGGTPEYTFVWTGPDGFTSNSANIVNLIAGTYSVTVTDANGCTATVDAVVGDAQPIVIDASITNVLCQGVFDGSITLTLSGGAAPYVFQWTGPGGFSSTDQDIFQLQSGNYTLVVTDDAGCITNASYTLTENLGLTVNGIVTDADCVNNNDGAISVTIEGGTEPYSSFWQGPNGYTNSGNTITGLEAGTYIFVVTDAADCFVEQPFTVSNPSEIEIDASLTHLLCNGDANGAITINILVGTPQSISWSGPNGFTSNDLNISGLAGGNYIITLTDSEGCTLIESFLINEPAALDVSIIETQPSCSLDNGQVVSSVSGGTPDYVYLWTNQFNETLGSGTLITNLGAGTYTLTVTDINNCVSTQTALLTETDILVDAALTQLSCGNIDGAIDITISGGQDPYQVSWQGPNGFSSTSQDIANLEAGIYNLTITDALGCNALESYTLTQPDNITIDINSQNVTCFGFSNGSITATISGGTPDYLIDWTGPNGFTSSNLNLINLAPGTYNLTVEDAVGCIATSSVQITQSNALSANVTVTNVSCAGQANGALSANITGGTQPYIIIWSGPNGFTANDVSISGLQPGTYTLIVTDDNNCLFSDTYIITTPAAINVSAALIPSGCLNQNQGSIILTVTGGTPDYSFSWTGPDGFTSNNQNINNLAPGDYNVIVTDDSGCQVIQSYEVIDAIPLIIEAEINNVLCQGVFDGFINLTLSGGSPDFTFSWAGPNGFSSSNQNIDGLAAGDYTITVTDNLGCITTETYTIDELEGLEATATITDANCVSNDDGAITVEVTGGTEPYSIFWQGPNGFTNNELTITGLEAGIYIFVATDAADCFIEVPFVVNNPSSITVDAAVTNILCNGVDNGAISLTLTGVIGDIDISWTGPNGFISTDQNIDNLSAGNYTLTIIDADGCEINEFYEITEPEILTASVAVTPPTCGLSNGQLVATITGGTPAYQVLWTDELNNVLGNNPTINNLAAGTYTLTVVDDNGCTFTEIYTLSDSDLVVDADVSEILCFGDNSGSIVLDISGGIQPYTVIWSGPNGFASNSPAINNLTPGIYDVTITDDSNCSTSLTFEILEPTLLQLDASAQPSTCLQNNGTVSAIISGGIIASDYNITWFDASNNPIAATADVINLAAGIYTIVVSDDNGCEATAQVAVSDEDGTITATITPPTCGGAADGVIAIEVTGGTTPYTFEWNGPDGYTSSNQNISGLLAGLYTVSITDSTGCVFTDVFDLSEPAPFNLAEVVGVITCFGNADGSISITPNGGVAPYSFEWSGPNGFISTDQNINNLSPGIYSVVVTDSLLCISTADIEITSPESIDATFTITNNLCFGDSLGSILSSISGGTAPYSFQWISSNGFSSTDQNINGLFSGVYELLITDSLGCTNQFLAEITDNPAISVQFITTQILCFGQNDGSVQAFVSGGTPEFSYTWIGPDNFSASTADITNLLAGTYLLTIIDSNLCALVDSVILDQPDSLFVTITSSNVLCFGDENGSIEVDVNGGTQPYTATWLGPDGFTSDSIALENLTPGVYSLNLTDTNGCNLTTEVIIETPDLLDVSIVQVTDALCNNDNSGGIEIAVLGGTEPYSFVWNGPDTFVSTEQNPQNLLPGNYNLQLTDANGCIDSLEVEIGFTFEIDADAGADFGLCWNNQPIVLTGNDTNATAVQWLNPQGIVIGNDSVVQTLSVPGTFTYYFSVSNGLCTAIDSVSVSIWSQPVVTAGIDETIFEGESATLGGFPTSPNQVSYLWNPGITLSDSTQANPIATPTVTTLYTVTVMDSNGCVSADSVLITILPEIQFPSGITPNGDGYNETWVIDYIDLYPNNVVEIYNRWGDRLYRAEGYDNNNGWDGFFNGKALPVGTYYYIVELNDERYPEPFTGPITIFR